MIEIQAPNPHSKIKLPKVFLGGSIEMGKAEKWQDRIVKDLKEFDIAILNPRRDDWDSSWKESMKDSQFTKQVNWELNSLDDSDIIIFYFDPKTKSPITLMELGLYAKHPNVLVCCPDGFWKKGNVEIVCHREKIKLFNTYQDLLYRLIYLIKHANLPRGRN